MLSFFPLDVLDEIWDVIEPVSEGFLTNSSYAKRFSNYPKMIAASINKLCIRWCKQEHVECDALKDWKLSNLKIIDVFPFILKILKCYHVNLR